MLIQNTVHVHQIQFVTTAYLCDAGAGERDNHSHHVDGQLELKELRNAVVYIPSPHDGLDDAGEVVVCKDDVRSLLRHVCAGNSLTGSRGRWLDGGLLF